MRKIGGYGAAISVTPYLLIKIAWTFGMFLPRESMGGISWRAINATTAILALVAILLAITFNRPWGERLPAWAVIPPVWVGTGLLVPMVLLMPVLGAAAGAAETWAYEQIFVIVSLVGIGIGLPIALAGYAKSRWPEALGGPVDCGERPGHTRRLQVPLARVIAAGCVLLGLTKTYWALGGTIGIDPARLDDRDLWWHLLTLSTGVWSLAGAWAILVLTARRGFRRFVPPMMASWISSGMLFSYNLFFAMRPDSGASPEYPLARVLSTEAGIVLGLLMALTILLVLHDRRREIALSREHADQEGRDGRTARRLSRDGTGGHHRYCRPFLGWGLPRLPERQITSNPI
jgi:hypothetical protein